MLSDALRAILLHSLGCVLTVGSAYASPLGTDPSFSFWRDLVIDEQTLVSLEYPRVAAPLPRELAERCCTIHPGEPLTLVRCGRVVGSGLVGDISTAEIPSAGEFQRVFFEARGLPDSANVGCGPPPFPEPTDRDYDLFVIGDVAVKALAPAESAWEHTEDVRAVVMEALGAGIINRANVGDLVGEIGRSPPTPLEPDPVMALLRGECRLLAYTVEVGDRPGITVQSCQRRSTHFGPFFVRVSSTLLPEAVLIAGELDYFLEVGGAPYMVLRVAAGGSGAWAYVVYRLYVDNVPQRVHADGSWST